MCAKRSFIKFVALISILVGATLFLSSQAQAQIFSSGSTGADGAFNPGFSQNIAVPSSGVFNFTTVNIPQGVTINFVASSASNKPVIILASGDVTIAGAINVAGKKGQATGTGGAGGPGGFAGGNGAPGFKCKQYDPQNPSICIQCECVDSSGRPVFCGFVGEGPGGGGRGNMGGSTSSTGSAGGGGGNMTAGQASATNNGTSSTGGEAYGSELMRFLVGGSGGGGGSGRCQDVLGGGGGGGGGGVIIIASSTKITLNGSLGGDFDFPALIDATGGGAENLGRTTGGGGAGGAIRLIANEITGTGGFKVKGGTPDIGGFNSGGAGSDGVIRLECHRLTVTTIRTDVLRILYSLPRPVFDTQTSSVTVVSIAGTVPANPPLGSLFSAADVTFSASQSNPVTINLATTNIPVGSTIKVTVTPSGGAPVTAVSGPVAGTFSSGSTTVSVNLLAGQSILKVTPIAP